MRGTAWIVDLTHRSRRIEFDVPPGVRALTAASEAVARELGVTLTVPLGVRGVDREPEFLFLLSRAGDGAGWIPLSELAAKDARGYALYVDGMLGGWTPPAGKLDVFHFGDGPEIAATLAHLVVKGVKRGTTGALEVARLEGATIPEPGMVSIVTDGFGHALCAIRTEQVDHVRFADIEARHAFVEGEGDRTLEFWRDVHLRFFRDEAAQHGLAFTEDSIVFFEHFRLIAVFGAPDA